MKIINKLLCQVCKKTPALGVFRNRWICGECLLKFESKIKQHQDKVFDIIENEIKKES